MSTVHAPIHPLQSRYDLDVQFEAHRDELDKIKSLVA
jgi:hypothetical protein